MKIRLPVVSLMTVLLLIGSLAACSGVAFAASKPVGSGIPTVSTCQDTHSKVVHTTGWIAEHSDDYDIQAVVLGLYDDFSGVFCDKMAALTYIQFHTGATGGTLTAEIDQNCGGYFGYPASKAVTGNDQIQTAYVDAYQAEAEASFSNLYTSFTESTGCWQG